MKIQAAKWTVTASGATNVTEIRANELWHDFIDGEEAKKDKLDRLFSDLREVAKDANPGDTHAIRQSTVPLIDAAYSTALTNILAMINAWPLATDEELKESGAYDRTTDGLFKYYGDAARTKSAYLGLIDEMIMSAYFETKAAYEAAVTGGGYASEGYQVTSWKVERDIEERRGQLIPVARRWVGPYLAESIILRPQAEYENSMRNRIGSTIESVETWAQLEASFFKVAADAIEELGASIYEGTAEEGVPDELESAKRILYSRERVYVEGQYLPKLSLPCQEVKEILDSLDAVLPLIKDGSEAATLYGDVYAGFHSYWLLRCATGVANVDSSITYENVSRSKLTTGNFNKVKGALTEYWASVSTWAWIEEEAAGRGRSAELQPAKDAAYAEIITELEKVRDDPWSGPLGRDPRGVIVPYAGLPIGLELYMDWIVTLGYIAYKEIRDNFTQGPDVGPEDYVATEGYATALLDEYKAIWENDPIKGVAMIPGYAQVSIKDAHWNTFARYVHSKAGGQAYPSIQGFKDDVEAAYVKAVLDARDAYSALRSSTATEFPARIVEIEEIAKSLAYVPYMKVEIENYLAELELLRIDVPPDSDSQKRYDDIYFTLQAYIDERGGGLAIGHLKETEAFYGEEVGRFTDATYRDRLLAEWLPMDYAAQQQLWRDTVWGELGELEAVHDLTYDEYARAQAAVIKKATDIYLVWRGTLIKAGGARLKFLTNHIRAGTASENEKKQADSGQMLVHTYLNNEINELKLAITQALQGGILKAALAPFAKFEPLKSTAGFDVEEFSFKHLDKMIENWVQSRIKDGLFIDPKINGYRIILEAKDDKTRLYLEGATKDYSAIYKNLAAEIKGLPSVILDGELTEEVKGTPGLRAELGKYRRSAVDDSNAVVHVFDILYLDGEDLHEKPYEERRTVLDRFFENRNFKHLRKLPSWKVITIDDFVKKAKEAAAHPASEGCMVKTADSKYLLGRRTGEWIKAKETSDLQVMVLGVKKTKANDYVYRCGVEVKKIEGIAPKEIEERAGKKYVVLGNTFRTQLKAKPGEHIEVSITEFVEQDGARGKEYNWMIPKVKDTTARKVDTLRYAQEVGQLLSASILRPWEFIKEKMDEVLVATSIPRLRTLKAELFGILSDLNYERVIRYAWNVVELIRERLGQAVDPLITDRGIEKIHEIETNPMVTLNLIEEIRSRYEALVEDIQSAPSHKANQAAELRRVLNGYERLLLGGITGLIRGRLNPTDENMLARVRELLVQIDAYGAEMGASGTRSVIDIERKLAEIERQLDDLIREEPDTLVDDIAELRAEFNALIEMGNLKEHFAPRLEEIVARIEAIELPPHTTEDIRTWLSITRALVSAAMDKMREGDYSGRFLVESTLPIQLDSYWRELTDVQKTLFKTDFDDLRYVLQEVKKMFKGLTGAMLWESMNPTRRQGATQESTDPLYAAWLGKGAVSTATSLQRQQRGSEALTSATKDVENPTDVVEEKKSWTPEESVRFVLETLLTTVMGGDRDAYIHLRFPAHYSYGAREFLTIEDNIERAEQLRNWLQTTDFKPVASQILESTGPNQWQAALLQLQAEIEQRGTTFIKDFDLALEQKARERASQKQSPEEWALGPVEYTPPPGASQEWGSIAKMKQGLSQDPMMQEIQGEFTPTGEGPFYQALDKAATGLASVNNCSGYYGGINATGVPFFVTAAHCLGKGITGDWVMVDLPNGNWVQAKIIGIRGDVAIVSPDKRHAEEVTSTMVPLPLATEYSGYGLMLGNRFNEAELVRRRREGWMFPRTYYDQVHRVRGGYSGGALINSRGEVMGILSTAEARADFGVGYAMQSLSFESYEELRKLYEELGLIPPLSGALLGAAALTEEGEAPANTRLDFMKEEPIAIPVKGTLWLHLKGIDSENKQLSHDELLKLPIKKDVLNLHHDLRWEWGKKYLEGTAIFLGNQEDKDKLLKYDGGKLGCSIKEQQPRIWGTRQELDNRLFPPGEVGNVAGKDTWGKMYFVANASMIPSRIRSGPKGSRYFEWYMKIDGYPALTGLWSLSEGAASEYDIPWMWGKMKNETPFHLRTDKKHEEEREELPDWQRPTKEAIETFLGRPIAEAK